MLKENNQFGCIKHEVLSLVDKSKSPRIRTYFFESQAKVGSYFRRFSYADAGMYCLYMQVLSYYSDEKMYPMSAIFHL